MPPRAELTDDLARHYLARVIAHARRIARRLPPHVALADLISAGLLGVVEGFLRFDPDRAETIDAFLDHRIRGALLDELRRADPLTRAQRAFARQLGAATRRAANDPGGVSDEALAGALGLGLADLRSRVAQVSGAIALEGVASAERVADDAPTPDREVAARQESRLLARATGSLGAREQEVLRLYYEEDQTFREIGDRLGVSESRVSQLHARAIHNLRALLSGGFHRASPLQPLL